MTFFDATPLKCTEWKSYATGAQKLSYDNLPPNNIRFELSEELQVHRRGKLAVTTATYHFSVRMKDCGKFETDARFTGTWQKVASNPLPLVVSFEVEFHLGPL